MKNNLLVLKYHIKNNIEFYTFILVFYCCLTCESLVEYLTPEKQRLQEQNGS